MIDPTCTVVMGGRPIGGDPGNRWLRLMWPPLLILAVNVLAAIGVAA